MSTVITKYDSVVLDLILADHVCAMNGFIVIDDMWMDSVQKAVAFMRNNRADYEVVETPVSNLAVFKKIADDSRDWRHFVDF